MTTTDFKRRQIKGRGIPVTGNDIDTDRIIPARFLKAVTFEGMGEHAFEDARKQNPEHPFNQEPVAVDVDKQEVRFGDRVIRATVPDGPRNQLVNGTWDSTAVLLEAGAVIETTARKLPYVAGF